MVIDYLLIMVINFLMVLIMIIDCLFFIVASDLYGLHHLSPCRCTGQFTATRKHCRAKKSILNKIL